MNGCVLDTEVVIAALDRRDAHHTRAAEAIRSLSKEGVPLLLSLVNHAETLVRPAEDEKTLRTARDALAALGVRLVAPTRAIAVDAAALRVQPNSAESAESIRVGVGATIYHRAMTAKELLLQEAPRWSEHDAKIALRAVQHAHAGDGADEWGNLSEVHDVAFGETMRRLGEEERAAGQEPW